MITINEAIDWELVSMYEIKHLMPSEQDTLIEIRDRQYKKLENRI